MTDSQHLLAEYRKNGSDAAFRELVTRYVDPVHSTALRLLQGDTHRAEDVAQTVFVDLARMARTFSNDVMLGGWLHRHTCFLATHTMRGECRRQSRERQAVEMNALQDNSEADFSLIAPILDEAINQLGEADRTAILLRFFEQHDFRSVGQALGSNEDAARMRVTRALEKLQGMLKRRGVTTSATTLAVVLSANAVQAAPVGLAAAISTAAALAGTTTAATATATATKAIAMTTLQKTVITAVVAVIAGAGMYKGRQASRLHDEVQTLQQQQVPLAEQLQQLTLAHDQATNQLAAVREDNESLNRNTSELPKLRGEVTRLRDEVAQLRNEAKNGFQAETNSMNDSMQAELMLRARVVEKLKQLFDNYPDKNIPELQVLNAHDWIFISQVVNSESDAEYLRGLNSAQSVAERKFADVLHSALQGYLQASNGQFPTEVPQLQPYLSYLSPPIDDAVFQRYEIVPANTFTNLGFTGEWVITQRALPNETAARLVIGANGVRQRGIAVFPPQSMMLTQPSP